MNKQREMETCREEELPLNWRKGSRMAASEERSSDHMCPTIIRQKWGSKKGDVLTAAAFPGP